MNKEEKYILGFGEVSKKDIPLVGGKNASLGEMLAQLSDKGVRVPDGFAFTTKAYWHFIEENQLKEKLEKVFKGFDPDSIKSLQKTGKQARNLIQKAQLPSSLKQEISKAYKALSEQYETKNVSVAVRSSGVAEDAPQDSFAGQFETFLNVCGEKELFRTIKDCLTSSFGDRVIAYREEKEIDQLEFALSIGVQKMVRSDLASSGVIFTVDTETGFNKVVLINSIWGVGEMIVKGKITPDEFYVFKPTLEQGYKSIIRKDLGRKDKKLVYGKKGGLREVGVDKDKQTVFSLEDDEILTLARWAVAIEEHYGLPQDIEWAKDGETGRLFIVQSRPETVHTPQEKKSYKEYEIQTDQDPILTGVAIGEKIGQGKVRFISDVSKISSFKKGEVLVTEMTDPDWVPVMRIASAIVTNEGGKTCHAAIVSRELGVPCIVGTRKGTEVLKTGEEVTVDCTQGLSGRVFKGRIPFEVKEYDLEKIPDLETKIMINIGAPEIAFHASFLPVEGVGLAREEFIITEKIKVHPLALYHYEELEDKKVKEEIRQLTIEHKDKKEYFVKELAEGIAQIGAAFYPGEVIVRFSDFKTNEYRNLIGGYLFEGEEANPMLGFRGASRYLDQEFQPAFEMECEAIKRVRDVFGLKNVSVMIPFCRTIKEGREILDLMKQFGVEKGAGGLKVYAMCEIPSNVELISEFLELFDGYSIGSNDLTQLTLGIDRDNAKMAQKGDERNPAVKKMIAKVIKECKARGKYSGICGEAPSNWPEFAQFLIQEGIDSISLNPDVVIKTILSVSENLDKEKRVD